MLFFFAGAWKSVVVRSTSPDGRVVHIGWQDAGSRTAAQCCNHAMAFRSPYAMDNRQLHRERPARITAGRYSIP